ncbi:hypothetical protein BS50DRAFT_666051 [Corynespora cassiicola Philippines]|uniref:Uncharacterized protein n=1 Tax=Corynespora cassiicola Philippines TaxID=1448308 RepID=A0A2T2NSI9_CORCC|nr:hypothetical protein BS50DRAFT_666051 [Corynespora cassiicola Philippines]
MHFTMFRFSCENNYYNLAGLNKAETNRYNFATDGHVSLKPENEEDVYLVPPFKFGATQPQEFTFRGTQNFRLAPFFSKAFGARPSHPFPTIPIVGSKRKADASEQDPSGRDKMYKTPVGRYILGAGTDSLVESDPNTNANSNLQPRRPRAYARGASRLRQVWREAKKSARLICASVFLPAGGEVERRTGVAFVEGEVMVVDRPVDGE